MALTQAQKDIISGQKSKKYVINTQSGLGTYMDAGEVSKWKDGYQGTDTGERTGFRLATTEEEKANLSETGQDPTRAHNIKLPNVTKATVPMDTSVTAPTTGSLKDQIVNTQKENAVNRFKAAFEQTKGRLGQEESAVDPRFRKQESLIGVNDTMSRMAADKSRATQGLSASGATGQDEMAQNVITQGSLGASREQEQNIRADIERRMTEAQSLRDQGIATAESEADITMMQNKLYELDALTAKQDAAELTSKSEAEAKDAQIKADYLSTIGRFYGDFQAEINRVKNDGDPSNDWQIAPLEQARQSKIAQEGLDQQGRPIPVDNTAQIQEATYNKALEKWKNGLPLTPEEMTALNVTTSVKPVEQKTTGGGGGITTPDYSTAEVAYGVNMLLQKMESMGLNTNLSIQYLAQNKDALEAEFGKEAVDAVTNQIMTPEQPTETNYIPKEEFIASFDRFYVTPATKGRTDNTTNIPVWIEGKPEIVDREGIIAEMEQAIINGTLSEEDAKALEIHYRL